MREGMAFDIYGFVITPIMGLMITVLIGTVFFALSVGKFNQADFSTIKVTRYGGILQIVPARKVIIKTDILRQISYFRPVFIAHIMNVPAIV